jgi:hypothetical protein
MSRERFLPKRLAGHHAFASREGKPLFEVSFLGLLERLEHLKDTFHRTLSEYHLSSSVATSSPDSQSLTPFSSTRAAGPLDSSNLEGPDSSAIRA